MTFQGSVRPALRTASALHRVRLTSLCMLALGVACSFATAERAAAQDSAWTGHAEASANLIFGTARSRVLSLSAGAGRADSTLEVRTDLLIGYADSRVGDDTEQRVTSRHTRVSFGVDHRPLHRFSPFVFGSVATSLQQRFRYRMSSGAGAKLTMHRAGDDDVSASLALLWERTRALEPTTRSDVATRIRWSLRLRAGHRFTNGLRLSHVTFYQPAVDRLSRYTADSNTSAALALHERLALTLTSRNRFDSEARARGARTNLDGELLFGLRTSF